MAFTSGTATGYLALLRAFREWVCGAALGTQAWTWLKDTTGPAGTADGALYLRAPGSSGVTRTVVHDCEAAWTGGTAVTATVDTTDYQVGSGAANLDVGAGAAANQVLAHREITSANLTAFTRLTFRIKSSIAVSAGQLQMLLDDTAACVSPLETLNVPALNANEWTFCEVAFATPANLTAIISVGIKQVPDLGACTIRIDDVLATGTPTENIFMNINTVSSVPSDWYNWELNGAIAFDPNVEFSAQPGCCTRVILCLYTGNIAYRFFANGRRAVIAANVGGVSEVAHIGFIKPYCPASSWPYPLLIGATNWQHTRYSDVTGGHQWFLKSTSSTTTDRAYLRSAQGIWNGAQPSSLSAISGRFFFMPYAFLAQDYLLVCVDGSNPRMSIMVQQYLSATTADWAGIGELDGIEYILGVAIANHDSVTDGGDTWRAIQDTFRTDVYSFAAVKEV